MSRADLSVLAHTAHHEAGHAVIARKLGVMVDTVAIFAEPHLNRDGRTVHVKTDPETTILITMAGPSAEARFTGTYLCAGDDERNIRDALLHLLQPREHYQARAADLVREHWGAIEAVAWQLLLGTGRLSATLLDMTIRDAEHDG